MSANNLHEADRHMVHQQADLDGHDKKGGMLIARGDGVRVWDTEGRDYIEAMAGLWCASLGFSEKRLAEAAYKQMLELPYYHTFFGKAHGPAALLSEKLTGLAPEGLNHVMFQCSGSEANDAAIKLIWYHNNMRGRPAKKKIIGRIRGYHGNTVATASLSGQPHMQADFDLPYGDRFLHVSNPNYYRFSIPGESERDFSARMAAELEALIEKEGADTIAAFFAEPVQGGGGAITPPEGYFELIQPILKKHDILFVTDEVICGFGRTGNMWGCDTYGLKPDILTCAKQLSASYQPISATLISDALYESLLEGSRKHGSFGHGFTYGAHPVACAVALETLAIYEERDILSHVRAVSPVFLKGLEALKSHALVGDARGVGLIAGVELMADKAKREPFPAAAKAGLAVQAACERNGLIVRAIGDRIAFTPPLIISAAEIADMLARFSRSLDEAAETLLVRQAAE
ncbi:aminotransferase class III-fold pyridoxal phosphate-dependent enzyme [Rhodovarius crocodyli]|uniref:Aminotransferase class III-fold pyridoxal phosphate-dependent enzyme n=1 Tax=Rhodovarius crocodyli TaxID=1979269 RepID=A0A437M190_9PROT|nr:aminotransferase [Rhodovarius crocodyli]RVT91480.1 aminotransferase class III-fold pyridoxal phosphate-dependent enzyme [Rhodovarius crocodyli]